MNSKTNSVFQMRLEPLSQDDRRKARDAFNALLDAPDDDKHALAVVVIVQALLLHRKKAREGTVLAVSGELNRLLKGGRHGR